MQAVIVVFNIQSRTNIGQIIRTANAFGVSEICVIGRKKFSTFGNHKTTQSTNVRHFFEVEEAIEFYRALNFDIVGIEITKNAKSVNRIDFVNNSVFILGNEGSGIQPKVLALCDYCVFIPQFGTTASINVNSACAIVLNVFTKNRSDYNAVKGYKFEADKFEADK